MNSIFDRDTEPIIAPRTTRGQGTHFTNLTNDDLDEEIAYGTTVLSVGWIVFSDKYGYGKVKNIWKSKTTGENKFKVVFEKRNRKVIYTYADDFMNGKLKLIRRY